MNALETTPVPDAAPASRKGARTRKDLLEAALRIIVREGHQQVTLRSVAQEAGQSHGSVAYHFGSRAALMTAAMEHSHENLCQWSQEVCDRWRAGAADLESLADALVEFYVGRLIENEAMGIVVLELNIAAMREDYLRPVLYKWGEKLQSIFEEPYRRIGSGNPAADFQFFLNSVNGLLSAQRSFPRRQFESKILRPSIVRLLRAIACNPGSPETANDEP